LRAKDVLKSQHLAPAVNGDYSIGIDMPDFSLNEASVQMLQQWAQEDADGNFSPERSPQKQ
jgi:hypothetical protein